MIGRRVATIGDIEQPGDYCGPIRGYTGDKEACFFLKPHTYRECDDGSLEIRASIGDQATYTRPDGTQAQTESDGWHGFLDEGHSWRLA